METNTSAFCTNETSTWEPARDLRFVTDDHIRDRRPRVPVTPVHLTVRRMVNWRGKIKHHPETWILYRITPGERWSNLDDLATAVVGPDNRTLIAGSGGGWHLVPRKYAPRLVAAFDSVGLLYRLQFMQTFEWEPGHVTPGDARDSDTATCRECDDIERWYQPTAGWDVSEPYRVVWVYRCVNGHEWNAEVGP